MTPASIMLLFFSLSISDIEGYGQEIQMQRGYELYQDYQDVASDHDTVDFVKVNFSNLMKNYYSIDLLLEKSSSSMVEKCGGIQTEARV